MDDFEYEQRRRALDEVYQADLAMLRAAHEIRLRTLETLRTSREPDPAPTPTLPAAPPRPEPVQPPAPPQAPGRTLHPDLRNAIEEALPRLPEVFTLKDVARAIGWEPHRTSLQRLISELVFKGQLAQVNLSIGRHPVTYRRV